jgi:MraZ protein
MAIFSSKYPVTVDGKGRVVLPASYKKEFGDAVEPVFAIEKDHQNGCLNIYPRASWEKHSKELESRIDRKDPGQRKFIDRYYEEIHQVPMAENGRLNIPDEMLAFAHITKEALFTGQGKKIRLWDPAVHQAWLLDDEAYKNMYSELIG